MAKRTIILAAVAAAALSSAPAAPFALARAELQTVAFGSRYFPEDAILAWSGERFTITRIDFLDRFSTERESIEAWMQGNEDLIDAFQAAVRSNPELLAALRARSVQINNIGAAQVAMNGNLVFYLR